MKKIIPNLKWTCLVLLLSSSFTLFSQVKYNEEKSADISKIAKKIATVNAKNLAKHGVKKVMIFEFFGEYVTSKETSPSTFEKMHSDWYLEKKSSIEMGSDFYETMTNQIYDAVKKIFTENGIEVLDKEVLLENPKYIELGLKEEKTGRQYSGGVAKQSVTSEVLKRSVTGMGMFSETLKIGAVAKINQMVPEIAHENGCNGAVTVKFRIGLGKNGAPTLDYINIKLQSNIAEFKAGRGKVTYGFKAGGDLCLSAKGLIIDEDISGKDGNSVDIGKYNSATMKLVNAMCKAYSYQIKEQL